MACVFVCVCRHAEMDATQEGSKQSCQQLISGVGADKRAGEGTWSQKWHFETPILKEYFDTKHSPRTDWNLIYWSLLANYFFSQSATCLVSKIWFKKAHKSDKSLNLRGWFLSTDYQIIISSSNVQSSVCHRSRGWSGALTLCVFSAGGEMGLSQIHHPSAPHADVCHHSGTVFLPHRCTVKRCLRRACSYFLHYLLNAELSQYM